MDWPFERMGYDLAQAWTGWLQDLTSLATWAVWGLLLLMLAVGFATSWSKGVRRGRLWCPLNRRYAEVAFAEEGFHGFRRPVAVTQCSIFEPPSSVVCRRSCLDSPRGQLPELSPRG